MGVVGQVVVGALAVVGAVTLGVVGVVAAGAERKPAPRDPNPPRK